MSILILPVSGKPDVEAADIVVATASVLEEIVVVVPELIFVEAVTVTGPATVPLFKITVALPLTVEPVAVAGVSSASPIYSPPPGPLIVKFTAVPSATGLPLISFTRNLIVELAVCPEPFIPITCGVADINWMLPAEAGVTVSAIVLLTLPAIAVIVTVPALLLAVNVVVAVPFPPAVVVDSLERLP